MVLISRGRVMGLALMAAVGIAVPAAAQTRITTPKEQFGSNIGDDYFLASYTQLADYWRKLDAESDRLVVQEIGKSAEGRPQLMAIITSPENHAGLARYRDISRRLALAEGLTDDQAAALAHEGKAVVWIDGGLHGTEVLGAHQLMETVYQMASRTDPETLRFLNDVVLLAVQANPDGMELVSGWYMREADPLKRSMEGLPRLYQKYIGHDNNRDFYMVNQPETENMARVLYLEWSPQILYNHHQTGPQGVILFAPPFRDPFNYNLDPLLMAELDGVGAAMHERFIAEGKPGATMRKGASYQTWWNGGLRTTAYFHNMIGLLTETKGSPTPMTIPFYPERQLPSGDLLWPVEPTQNWHFRQSIDYSITANRAVLDYASRNRAKLLYNVYLMGKRSIERGSRDTWTVHPRLIDAVKAAVAKDPAVRLGAERFPGFGREVPAKYFQMLRDPANRDPRGYIIRSDQPDFPTAVKFVNTLVKNGVTILQATSSFTVGGKQYPENSYVVKTAQAFRPHVVDMFEPQDYPNDFTYEGGPPIPPYDNAGYTLAYQMGVRFDRILDGFDGPFVKTTGLQKPPAGMVAGVQGAQGFLLSHGYNDGFVATNRLMARKYEVQWLTEPFQANGTTYPAGTVYIPAKSGLVPVLHQLATELGIWFDGVAKGPEVGALRIRPVRVALWDRYGGSMPSGWIRWLLERYEFPFERLWPQALDAGQLAKKYDVLIFPTEAIPEADRAGGGGESQQPDAASIPPEFRGWLGHVTVAKTVPQLKQFLADGGTIIAIGSSIAMGAHAGLPIGNQLVDASGKPLPEDKFYVPGSVLEVRVDNTRPIAYGMPERVDVFFDQSPVMKLSPDAMAQGVNQVAWFDSDAPLRSGWAWGQQYLTGGVAMAEAKVGRGQLYLLGPEVTNRGQPHGTFKFLFNGIYLAGTTQIRGVAAQ
ncbi:MAG: peptidase [Gemmatimonadetes bacterium]|nr:peptidase [Gemmatimonadota bacterium]